MSLASVSKLVRLPLMIGKHGFYFVRKRLRERNSSIEVEHRRLLKLAAQRGQDLVARKMRHEGLSSKDIILFSTMRNEAIRLPYFFDYYRKLGVRHFFIVDNGSTDGSPEILDQYEDVSWWHTDASYRDSRFGMDWLNHLLNRFGAGHWCVTVDPDEFLVFPHDDSRTLNDLTDYLDSRNRRSFGVMLVDMYPEGRVSDARYRPAMDPLEVAPFFDSEPYFVQRSDWLGNLYIQGGPRMRQFFRDDPSAAPALNKVPLIKWSKGYAYRMSMHDVVPAFLNWTYGEDQQMVSGALLHFKFLNTFFQKVEEEKQRKEHYNGGAEYSAYIAGEEQKLSFHNKLSKRFDGWRSLEKNKLISRGGWH